jgi:hypothetical protein
VQQNNTSSFCGLRRKSKASLLRHQPQKQNLSFCGISRKTKFLVFAAYHPTATIRP